MLERLMLEAQRTMRNVSSVAELRVTTLFPFGRWSDERSRDDAKPR